MTQAQAHESREWIAERDAPCVDAYCRADAREAERALRGTRAYDPALAASRWGAHLIFFPILVHRRLRG
jgi:hypothetical protein